VTTRRNPGEGGLHWEESRQRWFATVYVGYAPNGKRRKIKVSARTKTEAKAKLQQLLRDRDDGHVLGGQTYTVRDAVESWLGHGLTGRQESTVVNRTILSRTHVIPALGARKLAQLSAEEVDQWLAAKAKTLSTDTLHRLLSILRQSIRRAQARDLVKRNVALLCDVPRGTAGRPSKSLTLAQAADLLIAAKKYPTMHAYIVVSLLTGARTEELRRSPGAIRTSTASHRACSYGDQCERAVTRRRDRRGAPSNSRANAWSHFERTDACRPRVACATRHDGPTTIWSSRHNAAPLSTRPTFGVGSAR
jgi:hypothetical protein